MSRTFLQRTWRLSSSSTKDSQPWVLWDMGNEMWEQKKDVLRHFRVVDRQMIKQQEQEVKEVVEILPETPVPFEALARHLIGSEWEVQEKLVQQPQLQAQVSPQQAQVSPQQAQVSPQQAQVSPQQAQAQKLKKQQVQKKPSSVSKKASTKLAPAQCAPQPNQECPPPLPLLQEQQPPFVNQQTLPEQPKLPIEELSAEQFLQQSYMLPMELWSSLSQWIPPSALYQPSLHVQAMSELSDKPNTTFPSQRGPLRYSQPSQGQHRFAKQGQQSKPYPPKKFLPSPAIVV